MSRLARATLVSAAGTAALVALAEALADPVSNGLQLLAQQRLIAAGSVVLGVASAVALGIGIVREMAERRQIRKQIRDSEERFRQLAKIREVFWMSDPQKNEIFYVSPAYEEIWGRTVESLKRDPSSFMDAIHPDDRERVKAAVNRQATALYDEEYRIVRPDGSIRWIRDRSFPIADDQAMGCRIAGLAEDITANIERESRLRQAQKLVRRSERHLARAQAVAGTGSWELDLGTGELHWSAEMRRIFGLPESFHPTLEAVLELLERGQAGARDLARLQLETASRGLVPSALDLRIARPDGATRLCWCECEPVRDGAGAIVGIVGTLQDVTEQRHAEARRLELERQLQQSQKMEALGTLAGGIAHDLNNTLVPVLGLTELLLDELPADRPEREDLATIAQAAGRARDLVRQILAFSRKEAPVLRPVDVGLVVEGTRNLLLRSLPAPIEFRCFSPPGSMALADPTQLHQVVLNLVSNAAHAIGGSSGAITVTVADEGDRIRLTVADTGAGIDDAVLARIFEPFFTTKPVGQGTGLGLSVVHGIVTGWGGRIDVRSDPESGTVFDVVLPALEAGRHFPPLPVLQAEPTSRAGADISPTELR